MSHHTILTTEVYLPAYTASHHAQLIKLRLKATPQKNLCIKAQGNIGIALKHQLHRSIEIMGAINPEWKSLYLFEYLLSAAQNNFLVKDARSAGLPLAIGLLTLYREITLKPKPPLLIGTGILRIDGSIGSTHQEEIKKSVLKKMDIKQLITSNICPHLFELNYLMENTP